MGLKQEIPMAARLLVQDGIKTRDTNGSKASCTRWDLNKRYQWQGFLYKMGLKQEIPMARVLVQDGIKTRDTNGKASCTRWD